MAPTLSLSLSSLRVAAELSWWSQLQLYDRSKKHPLFYLFMIQGFYLKACISEVFFANFLKILSPFRF
jgi:hypothetical protein